MAARASAAQLHAAGMHDLVAASADEYEAIARALAGDRERLHALAAQLRSEQAAAPLFDMERYARSFENALERIWAAGAQR
jgi:protein O-GlcNAc transferase